MKFLALIKSIVITCLFPLTVLLMGPVAILLNLLFHNRNIDNKMILAWGKVCCWLAGVQVQVFGQENIPQDKGCLFLFNHSSFFDIFALAGFIPDFRFGAKAELFKIPVFGKTMESLGTLPIARNNREEVYKIYEQAKQRFLKNEKFALAPEGGRHYADKLSSFKAGPFVFAMSAEVDLVPVVILGAYECMPKGAFLLNSKKLFSKIEIHILPAISTLGMTTAEHRHQLQNAVYQKMNPLWQQDYIRRKSLS